MTSPAVPEIAITVRLPYAAAIRAAAWTHRGKPIENRGRPIPDKYIGQRVAIHAAATWSKEGARDSRILTWWWGPGVDRGALEAVDFGPYFRKILAVATISGCHESEETLPIAEPTCCPPWGDRRYPSPRGGTVPAWHITFADIVALAQPVGPVRGHLWVPWTLDGEVQDQIGAQLQEIS